MRALQHWEAMRGQVLVSVPVMVAGAFPGSLGKQQLLERAELTVSEFYFTIDEGTDHGFAIPADDIVDLTIVPDPAGHMRALRMRYVADHEDSCIRAFTIATVGYRRVARFKAILRLAAAADIEVAAFDPSEARPRSLAITWAHVRRFSSELMVWSGTACGPVGGWLAAARAECRVWMTTHSFFWCDVAGEGVNRLPVADIIDVTMDLTAETPVAALALRDAEGCRQEILFGFDRREFGDQAEATCRSLVRALMEYGVAPRTEAAAIAPWLPGRWPAQASSGHRARRNVPPADRTGAREDPTSRNPLGHEAGNAMPHPAPGLAAPSAVPPQMTGTIEAAMPRADGESPKASDTPISPADPWKRMDAFESGCLAAIRALDARTDPDMSPPDEAVTLHDALAALATLIEAGEIDLLVADSRARRMHDLAACRATLLTLKQHQAAGIRSRSAIITERRAVLARVEALTAETKAR